MKEFMLEAKFRDNPQYILYFNKQLLFWQINFHFNPFITEAIII